MRLRATGVPRVRKYPVHLRAAGGLRSLCQNYLGFELETTSPHADWWHRPLPAHVIRRAANEVAALVPLYHAMLAVFQSEWRASCFEGEL